MDLTAIIKDQMVRSIVGERGHKRLRKGAVEGLRRALADIERHHKRAEMIRGGGGPPHPDKLTLRTGVLSRSYTRRIVEAELKGYYGSDLVRALVHEFGSAARNIPPRPGLQRTLDAKADEIEKFLADKIEGELERG